MTTLLPTVRGHLPNAADRALPDYEAEAIARQQVTYSCLNGHENTVTFAADALVPTEWNCPRCGMPSGLDPAAPPPAPVVVEVFKSHFDYVRERRTPDEGDALIAEAIANMRKAGR